MAASPVQPACRRRACNALLNRVEMEPDMMDTASRRPHDGVEAPEALHEKGFGRSRILLAAAVRHRLATTGLLERVFD